MQLARSAELEGQAYLIDETGAATISCNIKLKPRPQFEMLIINLDSYVLLNLLSTFFVLIQPH